METNLDPYMSDENRPSPVFLHQNGDNDTDDYRGQNRVDEATEEPVAGEDGVGKEIKAKKLVKPQPKLDHVRLLGPRGIGTIVNTFKGVPFKGKGHEKEDLNLLMKTFEHWSHRLFAKYSFDDNIKQIEKLGFRKNIKVQLKRLRLDLYNGEQQADKEDDVKRGSGNDETDKENQIDVFDELLGPVHFSDGDLENLSSNQESSFIFSSLTDKQKERMERNRIFAAERRKQRMLDADEDLHSIGSCVDPCEKTSETQMLNDRTSHSSKGDQVLMSSEHMIDESSLTPLEEMESEIVFVGKMDEQNIESAILCTQDKMSAPLDEDF